MSKAKRYNPPRVESYMIKKGTLLYIFLIPLFLSVVIALFKIKLIAFLLNSIAFILLFTVVYLSKKGFAQEINYNQLKIAKAPEIRYKEFSAYLLGVTTLYISYIAGSIPLFQSIFLAVISVVGYWLYYGFDPRGDKLEKSDDISSKVILETFEEAQNKIATIQKDLEKISDTILKSKISNAVEKANDILDVLADDPKSIRVARRFLIVYIDGVSKVVASYNAIDEDEIDSDTKERLLSLMDDVDERFDQEMQKLKESNKFDLDVNIDVLKEQIKN
ncbi:hypothetical protein MNB_SV-6-1405 [hydrothermal vent metagenome]|uniref:5-bromo-4-chloroindolyl phosphate hydrolysis protein n=1 Tax=hydrothermal vent metagenome TaxID=652676 RepID=A0A1W1B9X2_9ZZZZ